MQAAMGRRRLCPAGDGTREGFMAKRWYSVSVLSNFEKKIAEQIQTAVAREGLEEEIDEVLVPTEEVIEVRRGKKVTTERRFMPGYVLVRMEMTDRGYHLITSINRVTGFLGPQGRPMPMRDEEVNTILNRVEEGAEAPRTLIAFRHRRAGERHRRPVRGLRGHGRGCRRRECQAEGHGLDLWPGDPGRSGIQPGVQAELSDRNDGRSWPRPSRPEQGGDATLHCRCLPRQQATGGRGRFCQAGSSR
jgi:transcriptional antiterminator NusG